MLGLISLWEQQPLNHGKFKLIWKLWQEQIFVILFIPDTIQHKEPQIIVINRNTDSVNNIPEDYYAGVFLRTF